MLPISDPAIRGQLTFFVYVRTLLLFNLFILIEIQVPVRSDESTSPTDMGLRGPVMGPIFTCKYSCD